MAFQSTVRANLTGGFPGDIYIAGPLRAQTGVLKTTDPANNVIGRALTHVAGQDGQFVAGGTGAFAGILSGRHQYALQGDGQSALAPVLTVPNELPVEAVTMTSGIIVSLGGAGAIGDKVAFNADGSLVAAPGGTAPGGSTLIENSKIVFQNIPAAGLAIIQLTE